MKRHKEKATTVSELIRELKENPHYAQAAATAEHRRQQLIAEHKADAAPVILSLREAGFTVESLDELRQSGVAYEAAVAVLLLWLPLVSTPSVKESIVRALSVPWAKPIAAVPLIEAFRSAPANSAAGLKWAIANALEVVANDSVYAEIVDLLRDKTHGKSREMLAVALGNMKSPDAADVLIDLLKDPEVAGHAIKGLGRLKMKRARPYVEPFLNHRTAWIRREAARTLAKLDK